MRWSGRIRRRALGPRGVAPTDWCYVFVQLPGTQRRLAEASRDDAERNLPYRIVYGGRYRATPAHEREIHLERCRDSYKALPEKLVATCRYLQTLPFVVFANDRQGTPARGHLFPTADTPLFVGPHELGSA